MPDYENDLAFKPAMSKKRGHFTHGLSHTRLNRIYHKMKNRCLCKTSDKYKYYQERGISICEEWKKDFLSFYNWAMNNGYSDELTIDRIDNNGNYCPENCRWVTRAQQTRNTRKNKIYNGRCLCEWYRISKMPYNQFYELVKKIGLESTVKSLELDKE